MSDLFATDPTGRRHAQQNGNPSNPTSLQFLFDDWDNGNKNVSPDQLAALCNLPTETIQAALDKAFEQAEDEVWKVLNGIRENATSALLAEVGDH
ncbi:MAG: hypothetical protein U5O16_14280 [Rhodococcus sp. (in: high G+C Gram-positive bacteria)]|uniref:hypothetical protein n=1 Tax=Rhodococcus sp. TaxID=1831 RepID=UPI002AD80348|nr:hypothetical protein [Rhodococcus sp. (in: high G+C Gram-positive bacteria)]